MRTANIGVRPLTPHLGAEIEGIDLSQPLSDIELGDIRRAFNDWSVLVFRDQKIDREQHKTFGRHFGKLHVHPLKAAEGYEGGTDPAVLIVKTTANSKFTAGNGWHTDVTCDAEPPMGSMLYITEVPAARRRRHAVREHVSRVRRVVALDAELPRRVDGGSRRRATVSRPVWLSAARWPDVSEERASGRHPASGDGQEGAVRELRVSRTHIKGLKPFESRALLDMLFEHIATTPSLTCRVRWEAGTLTFWDNRCTQHHAVWDYYPETRYGERVSIIGERPRF